MRISHVKLGYAAIHYVNAGKVGFEKIKKVMLDKM